MIETKNLILRQWQDRDRKPFSQLNADAEVMRYFPSVLTRQQSDTMFDNMNRLSVENGFCFFAVELKQTGALIGAIGLNKKESNEAIPQTPFVEIGWRLAKSYWGKGYAFEGATACLDYAFATLGLDKVYAFTALKNNPSWRLMEKLGMRNMHQDFNHPKLEAGHRLERHCLYIIDKENFWRKL